MKKLLNRRRQSPGVSDRKRPNINNMGSFTIVQPRALRRYLGVFSWEMVLPALSAEVRKAGIMVETGIFGAAMKVSLINDGPVTLMLER